MKRFFKHLFSALMLLVAFHAFGGETLLAKGDKAAASKSEKKAKKAKKTSKGKAEKKGAKKNTDKKQTKGKSGKKSKKQAVTKAPLPTPLDGKLNIIKEKATCTAKLGASVDKKNFAKIERCAMQAGEKNPNFITAVSESELCQPTYKKTLTGKDRKRVDKVCKQSQSIVASMNATGDDDEEAGSDESEEDDEETLDDEA